MPCTSPLPAWRPAGMGGRPKIHKGGFESLAAFERASGMDIETFRLDCGSCLSCRIAKQRDWAVRAMHESVLHPEDEASFLTLTYNDEHLPPDRGLVKADLRNFMKRLRRRVGSGLKYLGCGEYGDVGLRPHYHAALWGHSFPDRVLETRSKKGFPLYSSKTLTDAWSCPKCRQPIGFALLGNLTYDSAAYVAGYTVKKITGSHEFWHYLRQVDDGEFVSVQPEFSAVSRGGREGKGLAYGFYERFRSDLFPKDYVHLASGDKLKKVPVPRYYRRLLAEDDPQLAEELRLKRVARAEELAEDTPELRRARNATKVAERRMYGHGDNVQLDPAVAERLGSLRRPDPQGFDYRAMAEFLWHQD